MINLCSQDTITVGYSGTIVTPLRFTGRTCTVQLLGIPQYSVIEFTTVVVNYPRSCSNQDCSKCNHFRIFDSPTDQTYLCGSSIPLVYRHESRLKIIYIEFSGGINYDTSQYNITYKGE